MRACMHPIEQLAQSSGELCEEQMQQMKQIGHAHAALAHAGVEIRIDLPWSARPSLHGSVCVGLIAFIIALPIAVQQDVGEKTTG